MKSPRNILRYIGSAFAVLVLGSAVQSASSDALTDGTAIIDAAALRELDLPQADAGFGLRRVLQADGPANAVLQNDEFLRCRRCCRYGKRSIETSMLMPIVIALIWRTSLAMPMLEVACNCSIEICSIRHIRVSCWRESSTGWIAPSSHRRRAARYG